MCHRGQRGYNDTCSLTLQGRVTNFHSNLEPLQNSIIRANIKETTCLLSNQTKLNLFVSRQTFQLWIRSAVSEWHFVIMETHTHTHTQPFYSSQDFVRVNPGEPVPEETFTHSHLSWSSIIPYLLTPSITIHHILPVHLIMETVYDQFILDYKITFMADFNPFPVQKQQALSTKKQTSQ